MKNKFNIGDYVEVHYLGKVTEIYLSGETINYAVDSGDTFSRRVKENQLNKLPFSPSIITATGLTSIPAETLSFSDVKHLNDSSD